MSPRRAGILAGMFVIGSIASTVVLELSGVKNLKTPFGMEEGENHS